MGQKITDFMLEQSPGLTEKICLLTIMILCQRSTAFRLPSPERSGK